MKRYYTSKEKRILTVIIVVMLLAGVFTFISQKNLDKLSVYNESDKVEEQEVQKDQGKDIDMSIYTDERNGFSLSIPSDWQQVTKDGYQTFIHAASGSSLQIQVLEYDPSINNVSADTLSTEIAASGKTFSGYTRNTTSSYELLYQDYQNSTYDYIEEVYWDRSKIIKLICIFNDENYDRILPYYKKIIESFSWKRQSEIPEEYYLYYSQTGDFETAIPATWTMSQADSAIVAMPEEGNAALSVTVTENSSYLDSVTATDISSMLKNGKSNFIMQSYENSKEQAIVKYTYVANKVLLNGATYIYANGTYLYFLTIEYESGAIDESMPETCASLFREFISEAE